MFKFENPYFLLLILVLLYIFFRKKNRGSIKVPSIEAVKKYNKKSYKHLFGKFFILSSLILMIIALSRPIYQTKDNRIKKDGIDIVISLDLSQSMLQQDFKPNRLEKAKSLLNDFINKRNNDRISLVVFGGDAYTKVPLTFDHSVVKNIVSKLTVNDITSNNRTAIGMGLGVALNRLKTSKAKSKVIILMTDGENNSGEMNPIEASKLAKELGIKVYTIGIGAREIEVPGFFGAEKIKNTELDENLLKEISQISNGNYFRAGDSKEFSNIFNQINQLEKTQIDGRDFYNSQDYFQILIKVSLLLLVIGILFEFLLFIRIP